ncbi:hypothetical protein Q5P01_002877 [Channa striata]|uniref:C-type lectin domain-containing protein n=1 Tax=Channa striata TaxID=64152 RepID=A0AA88T8I6_CHASR|nr:hypothetical protein Q5P01_002877 [Channa striata]
MKILTVCVLGWVLMASGRAAESSDLLQGSVSCSTGWTRINDACYKYIPTDMSWAKAEINCKSMGAHLASVHSFNEYREIQKMIVNATRSDKQAWIGGSNAQEDRVWLWSDGGNFDYANWCPGEPNNYLGLQHYINLPAPTSDMKIVILCVTGCVVMVLAGVTSIWLRLTNRGSHSPGSDLVNKSVTCSEGWFHFDGRCFKYVQKPMSWSKAELNCLSMGAHLASVHNLQEYEEIQRQIVAATHHYNETWIGGSDAQLEDVWLWSDGSIFHYSHSWCPKEPNNAGGSQHCLRINYGDQKCWDDFQCGYFHPSVCAKKA